MLRLARGLIAIDTRSLALFRIALAAVILQDVGQRLLSFEDFYSATGVYPIDLGRTHARGAFSLYFLCPADGWQQGLLGLTLGLAGLLLVGLGTRLVGPLLFLCLLSLHARAPLALDVGDHAARYLLFWLILLPSGASWSLDARRRAQAPGVVMNLASAGLLVQMAGIYVWAGLSKLRSPHWLSGTAVGEALAGDTWSGPLATFLCARPDWCQALTWGTIAVEALVPYGLFAPPPLRYVSLVVLLGFNGLLGASIQLGLIPWVLSAGLLLFLSWGAQEPYEGGQAGWQRLLAALAWPVMLFTSVHHVLNSEPLSPTISRPLRVALAEQAWLMYLTPYPENFRLEARFLAAGRQRVLGLGARREGWPALEAFGPTERLWAQYRTRMYLYDAIADPGRRQEWKQFEAWLRRRWEGPPMVGELTVVKEVREGPAPRREQLLP